MASYRPGYLNADAATAEADETVRNSNSLQAWLRWQESIHIRSIDLGLERSRVVAQRMGLQTPTYSIITVAGTNGKGSSVAMLEAIWRRAGYRVAAYTSPHLRRYNERIRVNGEEADDVPICQVFERIEQSRRGELLTYFEFGTLTALALFQEAEPDIAILEVGLGGRLDAVNIVDPDVSLITALGIDHVEWLGHTREDIAREKAGIMRAGKPAVCSDPAVPPGLVEIARDLGAPLELLGQSFRFEDSGERWTWWSGKQIVDDLPVPNLLGRYQLRNAAGALKVVELMQDRHPVNKQQICDGLQGIELCGRFQRIPGAVEHILDVAHNEQAVGVFVETLGTLPAVPRTHVLLGMLKAKDHQSVVRALVPVVDTWHLVTLPAAQGATSGELAAVLKQQRSDAQYSCYDTVEQGYDGILSAAAPGERIIIIGSFVTVGDVLRILSPARAVHSPNSSSRHNVQIS
jgi:dihydrofolate synthase/folylpolyglutamate synthase